MKESLRGDGDHPLALRPDRGAVASRRQFPDADPAAPRSDELELAIRALSHDLRTPLVSVLGFSRLLRDEFGPALGDRGRHFLDRIEQAGRSMETLIRELLDFGATENGCERRRLVNPREVLLELQAELKPRLDVQGVRLLLPVDPPMVLADRTRLYQIFSNLIGNALDHMGTRSAPTIEVSVCERDGGHEICVRDNGRGIETGQEERIFEPFQCGVRPDGRRGTGLGLAIVKRIAEGHGGRAWAASAADGGASLRVWLPGR